MTASSLTRPLLVPPPGLEQLRTRLLLLGFWAVLGALETAKEFTTARLRIACARTLVPRYSPLGGMMSVLIVAVVVAALSASAPLPIPAQQWSAEQQEVWAVVTETWTLDMNEEDWVGPHMHDEGFGWDSANPVPRNKERTRAWSRFSDETTEVLEWEIQPLAIIVHGDAAVAHYYASWAERNANGDVENQNYKFTDTLVQESGGWLYLAWHGSSTPQN